MRESQCWVLDGRQDHCCCEIRSEIRAWACEHLGAAAGLRVLAVDETGDVKKGASTVGVQRQYSGTAGRIENCQLAVYLALATAAGHAAVDVRLYLPKSWTDDPERCRLAGVPEQVGFRTKPELAGDMIEAALDAGVVADFAVGDEAYGINPALRQRLRTRGLSYVLAVACTTPVMVEAGKSNAAAAIAQDGVAWQTRSAGNGAKGPRRYDGAWIDLADHGEWHGASAGPPQPAHRRTRLLPDLDGRTSTAPDTGHCRRDAMEDRGDLPGCQGTGRTR